MNPAHRNSLVIDFSWLLAVKMGLPIFPSSEAVWPSEKKKENYWAMRRNCMAEREGFEPPEAFRPQQFSRLPVSTTHTPLRVIGINSLPAVENRRWHAQPEFS